MTKEEYREKLENCQKVIEDILNEDIASPAIRSVVIEATRLHFELVRELFWLDNDKTQ